MMRARGVAGLTILVGLAGMTLSAQRPPGPPAVPLPEYASEEYLLLGDATRGAGEPMIAVDPTNPKNIIAVAMGSVQQLHGKPATAGSTNLYHLVSRSTINWLAVTNDGGVTWTVREQPILSGKFERCPDAFADVTKDGVFIAGCEPRETTSDPDFFGMSAFQLSHDKGKTWGHVVEMVSDYGLKRFAPHLKPISGAFPAGDPKRAATHSPWDRPFTHIDDSTGVIYGVAQGGSTTSDAPAGSRRPQAYVTASTNGGRSFGTVYSWDSPDYPQQSRGIGATAGHGAFAGVYVARSAPASAGATCPCAVLGISRDHGSSFEYRVLANITVRPAPQGRPPGPGGGGNGGLTDVAIDPTMAGRHRAAEVRERRYWVSVSTDWGRTWSAFAAAGASPDAVSLTKPAFEYSRDGVLGLIWRAVYADRTYDAWASISRDGGASFSTSLKVSHGRSPAYDKYRNAGLFGDDIQDIAMDREHLHLVWGDSRSGFQGVWYGRVALAAFAAAPEAPGAQ
jgi:hypothetical protein